VNFLKTVFKLLKFAEVEIQKINQAKLFTLKYVQNWKKNETKIGITVTRCNLQTRIWSRFTELLKVEMKKVKCIMRKPMDFFLIYNFVKHEICILILFFTKSHAIIKNPFF
jgi:hypothetical protein